MVEDDRRADRRHAARERALERERDAPALRRARLEQRVGARLALRRRVRRGEERGRSSVQHRLGGADDDDEVGVDERRVHAQRRLRRVLQLDELGVLDVVDDDTPVEPPRQLRGHERPELPLRRAPREPAGDEDRLVAGRDAEPLELAHDRADRELARVRRDARNRQRRRLDDDRRPGAAARQRLERLALEREPERVPHRGRDVGDAGARRRRTEHDRVVGSRGDDEPGA